MSEQAHDDVLEALIANVESTGLGETQARDDHGHHHPGHHHAGHHAGSHGEPGTTTTVRTVMHAGHEISIETTYRITIDGVPLVGHVEVLEDGRVHYHGLPNYAVGSMVGLMRLVVDHFGTEPPVADELGEEATR